VRNLAPLDLIYSYLCEMYRILTKGGKQYFITFIDDSTRFCYVYLLKSKDEALHFLRRTKHKVKINLRGKLNG
jgi:ubiquinone/menaquinone biosynthesis C-methylase UbiE